MMAHTLTAPPGGSNPYGQVRVVPPLPADIPILPGRVRGKRRLHRGLVVVLVIVGLLVGRALVRDYYIHYMSYDEKQIDAVVTQAVLAHAHKGDRLPVTLRGGPRLLQIGLVNVLRGQWAPNGRPTTCVSVTVIDPKTGAKDSDPKFRYASVVCVDGVYSLH